MEEYPIATSCDYTGTFLYFMCSSGVLLEGASACLGSIRHVGSFFFDPPDLKNRKGLVEREMLDFFKELCFSGKRE